jgi:hypothetical protein
MTLDQQQKLDHGYKLNNAKLKNSIATAQSGCRTAENKWIIFGFFCGL